MDTEKSEGAGSVGMGGGTSPVGDKVCASACCKNFSYSENERLLLESDLLLGVTSCIWSCEDLDVIPVELVSLEPVEAVLAWFVAIVVADSQIELCVGPAVLLGVVGREMVIPSFSASCASVLSRRASVSPSSNCNTSRKYSVSLYSIGFAPSGFCMSAKERFRGIGAIRRKRPNRAAGIAIEM